MKRPLAVLLMITAPVLLLLLLFAGLAKASPPARPLLQDGAPAMISYQGQVLVDSVPYTGTGYFKFSVVNAAGDATYWSNDGSATGGGQPTNAVQLAVNQGLFNVLLGDTSLTNMTALSGDVFSGTERYLRVWFSSSGSGFVQLSPDRRIAAVPYALQAEEAKNAGALNGQAAAYYLTLGGLSCTDGQLAEWNASSSQWQCGSVSPITATAWSLTGNAGTTPGTNYLGTSDNQALELRVNDARALRLEPTTGTPNVIGGYSGNYVASGTQGAVIGGGGNSDAVNRVIGNFGVVGGGQNNKVGYDEGPSSGIDFGVVVGGHGNSAKGRESLIGGGFGNVVSEVADLGVVVGGDRNTANGSRSFIGSGQFNVTEVMTGYAAIVGGNSNTAGGQFSFIGNGYLNKALGFRSAIVAGETNETHDWFGFIGNGDSNKIWEKYSFIGGGYGNVITGEMTVISGGGYHVAEGNRSTISGGQGNDTSANYTTIPGGYQAAATHYGEMAYASGGFADERGSAQTSLYVLRGTTDSSSLVRLGPNGGNNAWITLPVSRTMTFDILITAAADNGDAASYQYVGGIKHSAAGGTALIGSVVELMSIEDDAAWNVIIDASNDALRIRVGGVAGRTIHWVATMRTSETTMP